MIKVAVCDDEEQFSKRIKKCISEYLTLKEADFEIDIYRSGEELLELGSKLEQYSIVFLDIEMEEINGIEVATKIREFNDDVFILFVTAFIDYSLEGYKVEAVRYILKDGNLELAIEESLRTVLKKMKYMLEKKTFSFMEGKRCISLRKVLYIESYLHKLTFYVSGDGVEAYTIYATLNEMEKEISNGEFLRIHQSFLVNMRYVAKICRYQVTMTNGKELQVPKERYRDVGNAIVTYKGDL